MLTGGGRYDAESETLIPTHGGRFGVAHALTGEGFDASEDGTGRGTPLVPIYVPEVSATMVARSSIGGGQTNSPGHQADAELVVFDTTQITSKANRSSPNAGGQVAIAFNATNYKSGAFEQEDTSRAITTSADRTRAAPIVGGMQVRRLTPLECARLQGFPDNYLDITFRGKPAADGNKYRALGNSWAVPVAAWIARRIEMVDSINGAKSLEEWRSA